MENGADALLSPTDVEEAYSMAYVSAVAAGAGYVVSQKNFDRDGVDITVEAGDFFRPKLDIQLKSTIALEKPAAGAYRYALKKRNYDLLRIPTQTPRILVVLRLPAEKQKWLTISPNDLTLRHCCYWVNLRKAPENDNQTSVTIDVPIANVFDIEALKALMEQSRKGIIE